MLTKSRKPVGAAEALSQILCTYLTILKEQTAHVIYDAPQQERHTYIEHGKNRGPFGRVDLAEGGRYTCSTEHVEREREDESKGLGAVIESERASPRFPATTAVPVAAAINAALGVPVPTKSADKTPKAKSLSTREWS